MDIVHTADDAFRRLLSWTKFTGRKSGGGSSEEVNLSINGILAMERNYWRYHQSI